MTAVGHCLSRVRSARSRASFGLIAVLLGLGLVASACTSPKDVLGSNASPCFRSLAVAELAVHGTGHFAGVRYLSANAFSVDLARSQHSNDVPAALRGSHQAVCVVAYVGSFNKDEITKGWSLGGPEGHFALVVVSAKKNQLLASIVATTPPLRLSRAFPLSH